MQCQRFGPIAIGDFNQERDDVEENENENGRRVSNTPLTILN